MLKLKQQPLFFGFDSETEGVKYAGSKMKLIPHILELASELPGTSVLDAFSGSTRVSQAFAQNGFTVTSNDVSSWSRIFGQCYLQARKSAHYYEELIKHLNNVNPVDGWFTKHYGGDASGSSSIQCDGLKRPWQIHNTKKLDGIRQEIDRLNLDDIDKSVALASLILALDKVDSTLGHFVSYLQEWSPRSYNNLTLRLPRLLFPDTAHTITQGDVFDITETWKGDIAYLDPPYGSNNEKMPPSRVRYASYYHLWTTVILNDEPPLVGKAKRRADVSDMIAGSVFEEFRKDSSGSFIAIRAINDLIRQTQAHWIILSYSSGGRATAEDLHAILNASGSIRKVVEVDYRRNVMAAMKWTDEWLRDTEEPNREFLFLLEKH